MNRVRSFFLRALAFLSLVQWGGAPAQCLLFAAAGGEAAFICHADPGAPKHPRNGALPSDQCCAACPAHAHLALPAAPTAAPQSVTWLIFAPSPPRADTAALAAHASPLQPRAPPASLV